jgi:predicted O-methyltransferase YrrM
MGDHSTRLYRALKSLKVKDPALLHERMSWFNRREIPADPVFAQLLTDDEIGHIADWYRETNDAPYVGDSGLISMSIISDLILSNEITSVVQLGHYAGFGSLIMGFILRKVSRNARLISFDIDSRMNDYSRSWIKRAGLEDVVCHICVDSTDPLTLQMAQAHLNSNPQLIFIDASKQFENTKKEIAMWAPHIDGFIICHDVSVHAKGTQANGVLGVNDGMINAGVFEDHELLIIDPQAEKKDGYPYLDPCGLGMGVTRGRVPLPVAETSVAELLKRKSILKPAKLADPENWFCEGGWSFSPGKLIKRAGTEGWASCFAPVEPGQALDIEVKVSGLKGAGPMICAGGIPGTTARSDANGVYRSRILVGNENSMVGIHADADSEFVIDHLSVSISEELSDTALRA